MDTTPTSAPPTLESALCTLREMNEALLVASVRQHELAEQAQKAEAAMRESEHRYRTIVDQVTEYAIFSTDVQGRATTWNQGVKRILGFDEDEFIGQDISKTIFTPEDINQGVPEQELDEAAKTGAASNDRWMRRKNGERFFANGVTTALTDATPGSGQLTGFTKILRDQTDRKQAEEATSRLAAIVTSSEDAIISKSLDGVITSWNQGAERLFGYAAAEVLGKSGSLLIPQDHLDEEPQILERIRAGEVIEHYETVRQRKDGSLLDISLTISPLRDAAGRIIGASKIARDITERRLLEQTTKELAHSLADLHRRKDEFLAMLSHELRNPLAPIQNAVHLLRLQRDRSPLQVEAHGMIDRQVGQLTRLVDDLLEVSRITTGRVHLQEERVDYRGIVDRAIETTRQQTGQKRQALAESLPDEPIWVYGDPLRLEQIIVNLLNNASKYTDRGGHIWVELKQEGNEAILCVRDTGVGIQPEMLPRIFDLFTQADKSLDRSQGGLGIGLALVQSLVTMHRGRVEARSTPGQGSEFIVTLPVLLSPHVSTAVPAEDPPAPANALKVLVVDDSVDAAQAMAMLLRTLGHDALLAHDGASAMQAALEHVPKVVLLDIGLPVVDGYQVAKWIRQQPALRDVMLVALTGYGQESDRKRSLEAGFDHHLVKPVSFVKVESILSTVAEKAQ